MKVAVSIPDSLARTADTLARHLNKSRSDLYADALDVYLETHGDAAIRAQLDAVYSTELSEIDPGFVRAQSEILDDEGW